ncbi:hypothetical protein FACS1894166_07360 [Bacilli bacterium]|nr:hypothetical protein FACS1894166_07360 [Bacilli bacterium]
MASFALLFLVGAIVVGALQWTGLNNFYRDCLIGAKDFINVAFVIAIARGLSNIITDSGINMEIIHGIKSVLGVNEIFGTVFLFLIFIALSIFIPSTSGFAYSVFGPMAAPSLYAAKYSVSAGVASASMANGLANLFSPTAGPFVIGCEMAKVPLKHFYRAA